MSAMQPKQHLIGMTTRIKEMFTKDIRAIPPEKLTEACGGCSRAPLSLVVECAEANGAFGKILLGETFERKSEEERKAFHATFETIEQALAFLDAETAKLIAIYEGLDESTLGEMTEMMGMPMTKFAIAEMPSIHMMYHDGQLNYIQTLYGDEAIHWR